MTTARMVTIEQCRRELEAGKLPPIVDVRTPGEFASVHATGAVLMPLDRITAAEIDKHRREGEAVYLICEKGQRAAKAREKLDAENVRDVCCIEGGTLAWRAAGLPVVCGRGVISLERQVRIGAGSLVLLGLMLAWMVHPVFAGLSAFVGAGLVFAGITDFCGMAMVLAKMPWNKGAACGK